jgi:hypothetical protein
MAACLTRIPAVSKTGSILSNPGKRSVKSDRAT